MKAIRLLFTLAMVLVPPATHAAEEPEAVYAKFHRALLTGNIPEMKRYGSAAGGAEIDRMPPVQTKAMLEFMSKLMPKAYSITGKDIGRDGNSATLRASAKAADTPAGGPGNIQGTIRMLKEGGEWKVEQSSWGGIQAAAAKPQAAVPAPTPAKKAQAAAPSRKTPIVGSIDSAPERKLGAQKAPCVYKPVMTNEDIENCR